MKRVLVLAAVLFGFGLTAGTATANVEEEIQERITPVGEVCLEGEDCGQAAAAASSDASGGGSAARSGSEVYNSACSACHGTGAAGAPIVGEADAWAPRIDKGMETLVDHAINGFNAMPAKGGCGNCSDEEVQAAVEYMVGESQ